MLLLLPLAETLAESYYSTNYLLSAPAAGEAGTTAIHMDSTAIVAWADGYTNMQYGTDVAAEWMTPAKALGPAEGTAFEIVSLGRGGQITLTFPAGIGDRLGVDFTVFENSFSDTFLELAYVEVSSDGIHFVRFPNYSYTLNPVSSLGAVDTKQIQGLAGKYRQGYGTPFDLNELRVAYNAQLAGNTDFSLAFATALTNGFPLLDLNHITHVRLIDVVGDGFALESAGYAIYDPHPTTGSAGFDLDAVGVLNEAFVSYSDWASAHSVSTNGQGDADGDGVVDLQEYAFGGDPILGTSSPTPNFGKTVETNGFMTLAYSLDRQASVFVSVEASLDLETWSNAVPDSVEQESDLEFIYTKLQFSSFAENRFFRLFFRAQ